MPQIASQYQALRNAQGGTSDAIVYSAFPIAGPALAGVGTVLEKRFGRRLNLTVKEDPSFGWPYYPVGNYSPYGRQYWLELDYRFQ